MNTLKVMTAMLLTPTPWGWGMPCLYTDEPGEGKTTLAKAACEAINAPYVVLSPGEVGEAYFGAVPAVSNGRIDYPCPSWVDRVSNGGVVIVDELRTAPQAVRPALLGLILARRVGGHQLSRDVGILALSNNAADCPDGSPLDPASANRLVHVPFGRPAMKGWLDAVESQVCDSVDVVAPKATETFEEAKARVLSSWGLHAAASVAALRVVMKAQPKLRHVKPKDGEGDAPWASSRTWTMASIVAASCSLHGITGTERATLLEGCVGPEGAGYYVQQLDRPTDLPDIDALLHGKATWSPDPARVDIALQVVPNIAEHATPSTGDAAYRLLLTAHPVAPDAVVLACQKLFAEKGITPTASEVRSAVLTMLRNIK